MILEKLFKSQQELDNRIIDEHSLQGKDLFDNKVVAFIVEMGELSNEVRWFKHWSNKGPSDRDTILMEYVDSLHFLLSLGNDLSKLTGNSIQTFDYNTDILFEGLTETFIDIISSITMIKHTRDMYKNNLENSCFVNVCLECYIKTMERLLMLGEKLGFSYKDVEEGYYKKHQENYNRQDRGY